MLPPASDCGRLPREIAAIGPLPAPTPEQAAEVFVVESREKKPMTMPNFKMLEPPVEPPSATTLIDDLFSKSPSPSKPPPKR